MAHLILTFAAPWDKPPPLRTTMALEAGPPDPFLADDFLAVSAETEAFTPAQIDALRAHRSTLTATARFEGPGKLDAAREAARLMADAFAAGALGVRVETGLKVLAPDAVAGLDLRDKSVLLHLFVEVLFEDDQVCTLGLQAFDLPDVAVRCDVDDDAEAVAAQGAAFALAAKMVIDGVRPIDGGVFRASESAPLYRVVREAPIPEDEATPFDNPRGLVVLKTVSGSAAV
ncbi:MAG: hypothetical protein KC620_14245 [Myxococcales bacterium]|nr:hypothetical protein [Myxococcales bacterium]